MKKILDWLTWLLWTSEIVFLSASTPHIATYFYHFDNPTNFWSQVYAWSVGYGLALTLDGVSFVILMSLVVAIRYKRPMWLTSFLILALLVISSLSWFINWQYDLVFRSNTFAIADNVKVHVPFIHTTIGSLNPIIGGAFPFLSVLYALVAKALEVDESELVKSAMTSEQFEAEKRRIRQEQELKSLKASGRNGKGLVTSTKEFFMGTSMSIQSDETTTPIEEAYDDNEDATPMQSDDNVVISSQSTSEFIPTRNISLESACEQIGCDMRTLKQLISKGKIKTHANSDKLVTKSSLDHYLITRRRRKSKSDENDLAVSPIQSTNDTPMNGEQSGNVVTIINDVVDLINNISRTQQPNSDMSDSSNGHSMQDTEALSIPLLSIRAEE